MGKKQIQAPDEEHNPSRPLCDADHNSIGLVSTGGMPHCALAHVYVPESAMVIHAVLLMAGALRLLLPLSEGPTWGWASGRTIGLFIAGAALLGASIGAVFLLFVGYAEIPAAVAGYGRRREPSLSLAAQVPAEASYTKYPADSTRTRSVQLARFPVQGSVQVSGAVRVSG
jgi:hypothetical protein